MQGLPAGIGTMGSWEASDPYWNNVVSCMLVNTDLPGGVLYDSKDAETWTNQGAAADVGQYKFAPSSLRFVEPNRIGRTSAGGAWDFRVDHTLEWWIRAPIAPPPGGKIFTIDGQSSVQAGNYLMLEGDRTLWMRIFYTVHPSNQRYSLNTPPIDAESWTHIEYGRKDDQMFIFANGEKQDQTEITTEVLGPRGWPVYMGRYYNNDWPTNFWLGGFRATFGVCRHADDFNPPPKPFPTQ